LKDIGRHRRSTGNYRTVIAATKLPTVTDVPLYFKAASITLQPDERSSWKALTLPHSNWSTVQTGKPV
jgi:hypothetical protein